MTTNVERFILDANSFITPYNTYYPFDLTKKFWDQLKHKIYQKDIFILDLVFDEVTKGDDDLSIWMKNIDKSLLIKHGNPSIINVYSKILNYIQSCCLYKEKALSDWSKADIADPWLIAAASVFNLTIITFEKANRDFNINHKSSKCKIPTISTEFNVQCKDLFYMMRKLSFAL